MDLCVVLLLSMSMVLVVSGHRYYRRPVLMPHHIRFHQRRIAMPRYYRLRLPATITEVTYRRLPNFKNVNYIPGTTGYPTYGQGPFYRPVWQEHSNTYHPRGTINPDVVIPAESNIGTNGVTVNQIGPDTGNVISPGTAVDPSALIPNSNNPIRTVHPSVGPNGLLVFSNRLPVPPRTGFLEPVTPEIKNPDTETTAIEGSETTFPDTFPLDPIVSGPTDYIARVPLDPVVTEPIDPVVSAPLNQILPVPVDPVSPDNAGDQTETLSNVITSLVDEEIRNNSCHVTGCGTGQECVFGREYICPIHIPYIPCSCVAGCRLEYQFIPIGQSIKIDGCGNTCSCNNMYGAAECTQRMCNPENIVPEGTFPEITSPPPATVPVLKDLLQLQRNPVTDMETSDKTAADSSFQDATSVGKSQEVGRTSVDLQIDVPSEPLVPEKTPKFHF